MFYRHAPVFLVIALVISVLSARLSPELGIAATGVIWLVCALCVLRLEQALEPLRVTLAGLSATAIALLWWVDAYGVIDPASAWIWVLGWGPPLVAGFVVARSPKHRALVMRCLAWIGAALGALHVVIWIGGSERAAFLFTNPNISAAVMVGLIPCTISLVSTKQRLFAAILCLGGLAATGSRGGMLALAAMVGVYLLLYRGDRRIWLSALVVALLCVPFAANRLGKLADDPYAYGRSLWWRSAWQVNQNHPAGVGTRQFGWYGLRQRSEVQAPVYRYLRGEAGESAHSEWLQLLVDHSLLGLGLLLLCIGATLARSRLRPEPIALAGLLVHAAVDGTWQSATVRMLLLVHAMALWRSSFVLPWRLPASLFWAPLSVWILASVPLGYAQLLERSALRDDRLAARQGTVNSSSRERLKSAAVINRLDPDPLSALAQIDARVQRWNTAFDSIERAIERAPARPQLRRLALVLYARAMALGAGNTATAVRRLEHAQVLIQLEPMHAVDRFAFAQAALGLGHAQIARSALQTALKLEPNYRVVHLALAGMNPLQAQEHLAAAAAIRQRMLKRYCADRQSECKNHILRVMTRLEIKMLGDLADAKDRLPVVERFASWPRPPLAPWPGITR